MVKKIFIILWFMTLGIIHQASAEFNLPRYVFKVSQLEQACQEAINQNKALTFLYSDKKTTCSLCTSASNDVIYSLDKRSIIVYAEQDDIDRLPPLVVSAIRSPAAGRYIPISVIVNPQIDQVIYVLPYQRQNRIVLINEAKDRIQKYFDQLAVK